MKNSISGRKRVWLTYTDKIWFPWNYLSSVQAKMLYFVCNWWMASITICLIALNRYHLWMNKNSVSFQMIGFLSLISIEGSRHLSTDFMPLEPHAKVQPSSHRFQEFVQWISFVHRYFMPTLIFLKGLIMVLEILFVGGMLIFVFFGSRFIPLFSRI